MTVSFYLFDKQDGVPVSKQKSTPIRLVVNHRGKQYRKLVGISVKPADFKKQRTKNDDINKRLRIIQTILEEKLTPFSTGEDVERVIGEALAADAGSVPAKKTRKRDLSRPEFWDYFKEWSERDTPSKKDRALAYKRVSEIMGRRGDWEDIDESWYFRFIQKCNDLGLSGNYQATLSAKVKTVLIEGRKLKFHDSSEYKKFKYKWETADAIALSQAEVDALWCADLEGRQAMARDLFMLGVYTASRFQNYSRLTEDNISNGMIQFVQPKTGDEVLIPLSPRVKAALDRNGGAAPKMTEQELGRHLKDICKNLGGSFLGSHDVRRTEGGRVVIKRKQKWERVSSHTARRTGATLLHLAGVPDFQLMKLTGHRTLQNFQKYLRISKEDNARLLAKLDFFK